MFRAIAAACVLWCGGGALGCGADIAQPLPEPTNESKCDTSTESVKQCSTSKNNAYSITYGDGFYAKCRESLEEFKDDCDCRKCL